MNLAAILGWFAKAFDAFLQWRRESELREDGANRVIVKEQADTIHDLQVAQKARDDVRARADADPDGVLDHDDGFRRD